MNNRLPAERLVGPYGDPGESEVGQKTWQKVFRKGGPLEWFNPPEFSRHCFEPFVDIGTEEDWATGARTRFHETTSALRRVD